MFHREPLDLPEVETLASVLGDVTVEELLANSYELASAEVASVRKSLSAKRIPPCDQVRCSPRLAVLDLPYFVHSDAELRLMLMGEKPLSYFSVERTNEETFGHQRFPEYIECGVLTAYEFPRNARGAGQANAICLTVPGQEWRARAMELLLELLDSGHWDECAERYQGRLLGYSEEENDMWIGYLNRSKVRHRS